MVAFVKWLFAALGFAFLVCVAGFAFSSGLVHLPPLSISFWPTAQKELPLPPTPPPWHVVALIYQDGKATPYEPQTQRWDEPLYCWLEVTRINKRWRTEDRIGVATCRD